MLSDEEKKEKQRKDCATRVRLHYRTHIANDKVMVYCDYCKEEHNPLRLTHDKNVARNGRYICEREGGHIAGSRPKTHQIKENPYAAEGKKKCSGDCGQILLFDCFSPDKTKRDGYCSVCKSCRTIKNRQRYHEKKQQN